MNHKDIFSLESYDYELPQDLIAQNPAQPADSCKFLVCEQSHSNIQFKDMIFKDIINLVQDSVFFFNDTKVIKSRIFLKNVLAISPDWVEKFIKDWEIFFLRHIDKNSFEALVRPGKKFVPWTQIIIDDAVFLITDITKDWRIIKTEVDIEQFMEKHWVMPLPPYIDFSVEKQLPYQPIFAQNPWSVASPTASLHFTKDVLDWLKAWWNQFEYITLHIWLGTFKMVDSQDIRDYDIHTEQVSIDKDIFGKIMRYKLWWKSTITTWTTATRVIESLPYLWIKLVEYNLIDSIASDVVNYWNDFTNQLDWSKNYIINVYRDWNIISFETKLFIFPWFEFKIIDWLITNFHLPKSSLLMLVAWLVWYENLMKIYEHAIAQRYKFFSFWDAMFVKKIK